MTSVYSLSYLDADTTNEVLRIYPERRDWTCSDDQIHVIYHIKTCDRFEGAKFAVHVDAAKVPYGIFYRVSFFKKLCKEVRARYKEQIKEIIVKNTPWHVKLIVKAFHATGTIAKKTYDKILLK